MLKASTPPILYFLLIIPPILLSFKRKALRYAGCVSKRGLMMGTKRLELSPAGTR
jgi:hypothetical protein